MQPFGPWVGDPWDKLFSLQRLYSPGWASSSFKSFLHPPRFRATLFQFLHPSLATSSSTPSSQRSLGLPLGHFPPGSLWRTLMDKSSLSWCMTCPAHLSLISLHLLHLVAILFPHINDDAQSKSHQIYMMTLLSDNNQLLLFCVIRSRRYRYWSIASIRVLAVNTHLKKTQHAL